MTESLSPIGIARSKSDLGGRGNGRGQGVISSLHFPPYIKPISSSPSEQIEKLFCPFLAFPFLYCRSLLLLQKGQVRGTDGGAEEEKIRDFDTGLTMRNAEGIRPEGKRGIEGRRYFPQFSSPFYPGSE